MNCNVFSGSAAPRHASQTPSLCRKATVLLKRAALLPLAAAADAVLDVSATTGLRPSSWQAKAAASPAGPAPAMMTSARASSLMCFLAALNAAGENGSSQVETTRDGNLAHERFSKSPLICLLPEGRREPEFSWRVRASLPGEGQVRGSPQACFQARGTRRGDPGQAVPRSPPLPLDCFGDSPSQ